MTLAVLMTLQGLDCAKRESTYSRDADVILRMAFSRGMARRSDFKKMHNASPAPEMSSLLFTFVRPILLLDKSVPHLLPCSTEDPTPIIDTFSSSLE